MHSRGNVYPAGFLAGYPFVHLSLCDREYFVVQLQQAMTVNCILLEVEGMNGPQRWRVQVSSGLKEPFAERAAKCNLRRGVTKFHFDDVVVKRVRVFNQTGLEFTVIRRLLLYNVEYEPPRGVEEPYVMDKKMLNQLKSID